MNENTCVCLTLNTPHRYSGTCYKFMPTVIHDISGIAFDRAGTNYQAAFHPGGIWGYSLLPLRVINGRRGLNANGVACSGVTHGNEYEGQIAGKRLCCNPDPDEITGRVVLPQRSVSACVANFGRCLSESPGSTGFRS